MNTGTHRQQTLQTHISHFRGSRVLPVDLLRALVVFTITHVALCQTMPPPAPNTAEGDYYYSSGNPPSPNAGNNGGGGDDIPQCSVLVSYGANVGDVTQRSPFFAGSMTLLVTSVSQQRPVISVSGTDGASSSTSDDPKLQPAGTTAQVSSSPQPPQPSSTLNQLNIVKDWLLTWRFVSGE